VSEETGFDLTDDYIDAQMTPNEIVLSEFVVALTRKIARSRLAEETASGVSEETGFDLTDDYIDAQMTPNEIVSSEFNMAFMREIGRSRLEALRDVHKKLADTRKERVKAELQCVVMLAQRVYWETKEVDSLLGQMATLTQAENTISQQTEIVQEQSKRQRTLEKKAEFQYRREDAKVFPKNSPSAIEQLHIAAKPVPEDPLFHKSSLREVWNVLDDDAKKRIQAIDGTYNAFIEKITILDRPGHSKTGAAEETAPNTSWSESSAPSANNKRRKTGSDVETREQSSALGTDIITSTSEQDDYKKKTTESTKMLTKLFRLAVQSGEKESVPADKQKTCYFPGPRGQEVYGAQPFFACLLEAISLVADAVHIQQFHAKREAESSAVESPQQEPKGPPMAVNLCIA
jgi:hypothetical protein